MFEKLGPFKLKDRSMRSSVEITFGNTTRPMSSLKKVIFSKVHGENNKFLVLIEWEDPKVKVDPKTLGLPAKKEKK